MVKWTDISNGARKEYKIEKEDAEQRVFNMLDEIYSLYPTNKIELSDPDFLFDEENVKDFEFSDQVIDPYFALFNFINAKLIRLREISEWSGAIWLSSVTGPARTYRPEIPTVSRRRK